MANLKEIRSRITSVSSTMQITSAMKMVSAAKLKKAQDAITAMRPYSEKLTELIQGLSASLEGDVAAKYTTQREVKKVLVVAITSNRGLCGALNSNVLKQVKALSEKYGHDNVGIFAIGKKANDGCRRCSGFPDILSRSISAAPETAVPSSYGTFIFPPLC